MSDLMKRHNVRKHRINFEMEYKLTRDWAKKKKKKKERKEEERGKKVAELSKHDMSTSSSMMPTTSNFRFFIINIISARERNGKVCLLFAAYFYIVGVSILNLCTFTA